MKKSLYLLAVLGLAACSVSEEPPEQTPPPQEEEPTSPPEETGEKEVNEEINEKITVDFDVELPTDVEISDDNHLSAMVASDSNYYEVAYYETAEKLPVNDALLTNEEPILLVKGTAYDSKEEANEQIGYQEIQEGTPEIDLGHEIIGYQDAGAGSVFVTWHEGRWSFTTRSRNDEIGSSVGQELSAEIVEKLENQTLPIPHENGAGLFSSEENSEVETNRLAWQAEKVVYEVYKNDAIQLIDGVTKDFK